MDFNNLHPFYRACKDGDVQTVSMFLNSDKYLLVSEDQYKNWSPVHWAAYGGHFDCLRQLVSCEPLSINVQSSKTFQTPLHCAAEGGHPQCVLWLLQAGVNPEVKDNSGETALHKASRIGSAECVGLLISATSNISAQNSFGQTPSMLADISGFPKIASFIRQHEMTVTSMQTTCDRTCSFPVASRLNRKRTRDLSDFENPFKRQRSLDITETVLTPLPCDNNPMSSMMDHEDLCDSEIQYSNYMFESLLREFHGC